MRCLGKAAVYSCLLLFVTADFAYAQEVIELRANNRPLASLLQAANSYRGRVPFRTILEVPNFFREDTQAQKGPVGVHDPVLRTFSPSAHTSNLTQFDGSDNTDNQAVGNLNVTPPDANGDVSADYYVQMINVVTTIFDKTGTALVGPFLSNAFWSGFGGVCERTNSGSPIVLYDETNDRWLVSQFASEWAPSGPWLQCVAVSQTGDPLGGYNRYAFYVQDSVFAFPDNPKFGFTTESVTTTYLTEWGTGVFTFIGAADKNCMYAGNPSCALIGFGLGTSEFGFVAADLDDPSGTAGFVPALFATAMTTSGLFDIWEVAADFGSPANTTITRIERVPISSFDSDLCTASRERCVPHPGSGDDLETLSGRLMHRLQIRDFGTHLSMVAAHTVDADSAPVGSAGRAGIRWYELRSTDGGTSWSLYQEGTHAPNDGLHRWMPSIGMNAAGDIGVGYMVSDATTPVGVRISGQSAAASGSGAFDAAEGSCRVGVAGADWTGRAGDYSSTSIDPVSDTFWHTNEFGRSGDLNGWGTAVCEFEILGGPVSQAPVVTITAPPNGTAFESGDTVNFTATAIDAEDGAISASVDWSSDLDGGLGSGASVGTTTLSPGTHSVTAEATDSGGNTGSDHITITVNPPPVSFIRVSGLTSGTLNAGQGNKNGTATVTVTDENGALVEGALATLTFSGDFNESGSEATDASGTATVVTTGTAKGKTSFSVCVADVSGPLVYDEAQNTDPSYACGPVAPATDVHVDLIDVGSIRQGRGTKLATATAIIHDDAGQPAAGYLVTGTFGGNFGETASGTTSAGGTVNFTSARTARGRVAFCVASVTGALPYNAAANSRPRYDCAAAKAGAAGDVTGSFDLDQNYPNPFNPTTVVSFTLPESSHVTLRVYDVLGRVVATLVDDVRTEGMHRVPFDALSLTGGLYIYTLEAAGQRKTRRMTLLR